MRELDPMDVVRVYDDTGSSHIEPPISEHWSDEDKLRWCAAVAAHDTGLPVRINVQHDRQWRQPALYGYKLGCSGGGPYDYRDMSVLLTGFTLGVAASNYARETT